MTATPDYSTWLNDAQACAELACTPRTLDRKAAAQELHPQQRQRQGKRAERVWDPAEIASRKMPRAAVVVPDNPDAPIPPNPTNAQIPTHGHVGMSGSWEPPAIRTMDEARMLIEAALESAVAAALDAQQEPQEPTLWVDLEEASEITGLSVVFLSGLVKSGALPAVRDRVYRKDGEERQKRRHTPLIVVKVLRSSLDELDVRAELIVKPPARGKAKA